MEQKFNKIESFVHLNGLIQYFDNEHIDIKIYIDNSDVLTMLQGLRSMMTEEKGLDTDKYNSTSTLIYSLIFNKYISSVNISVPHQEELMAKLKEQRTDFNQVDEDGLHEFWRYVVNKTLNLNATDFEQELPIQDYIKKLAPKSDALFKANYLLTQINWRQKFKYLTHNNILEFDKNDDDLVEIVRSDIFKKIHEGFKESRPGFSKNNLTDAMTLTILHSRIKEYKRLHLRVLPVFYDQKGLFKKILKQTGTTDEFTVKLDGRLFSVLVDGDFLIYLALYNNHHKFESSLSGDQLSEYSDYKKLSSLISEKKQIGKFVREYNKIIKNFVHSRFLQMCWVENDAKIHHFVEELINTHRQPLRSKESRDLLDLEMENIFNTINDRTERFAIFKEIYTKISFARSRILKLFTENLTKNYPHSEKFDVLNGLSFIRFSTIEDYSDDINKEAKRLLFQGAQAENSVITYVVENVLSVLQKKQKQSIVVSILILWIIEEYSLIDRIFNMLDGDYPHYSEGFIHASAIAKDLSDNGDNGDKGRIIGILNGLNLGGKYFESSYKLAIPASYVYFYLWYKNYNKSFLTIFKQPSKCTNQEIQSFFDYALFYAELAISMLEFDYEYTDKSDFYKRARYYYSLNNKIYFVTMGSDNTKFFKLSEDVAILEALEEKHPAIWEYRYHDTLALYYVRRALNARDITKNRDKFNRNLQIAKERITMALENVFSNEDQVGFRKLKRRIDDIEWETI